MSQREAPLEHPAVGGDPSSTPQPLDASAEGNDLPPPPPPSKTSTNNEETIPQSNIIDEAKEDPAKTEEEVEDVEDVDEDDDDDAEDDDDDDDDDDEDEDEDEEDVDEEEDILATLPKAVVRRVDKLKELNNARDALMEEYLKERAALELKYLAKCQPLFEKRKDIIVGNLDDAIDSLVVPQQNEEEEGEGAVTAKGVPQFWACAMSHLETVAELVTEQDVDCLEHLIDVTCEEFVDGRGFTLFFHFEPNDYFTNNTLTKRYEIPNLLLEDEPILKSVTGCSINWKPNKCLTYREVQKKQRSKSGRRAGQIRTVTRREHTDSFFHFFNPPKMPSLEEMDEEEAEAIEEAFDHDYDVAQSFRNHLIPKGVLWFTGEALEEEMLSMMAAEEEEKTENNE